MSGPVPEIRVFDTMPALFQAAAERFVEQATSSVALSGGSTPKGLFDLLSQSPYREQANWRSLGIYWGDERCVPPDNPDSNYGMAKQHLLDNVPVERVYRMKGELDPQQAAAEYEKLLPPGGFDLALQGLGSNSHTASLFPHTGVLKVTDRRVAAVWVQEVNMWRITITIPELQRARHTLFLAAGEDKAEAIRTVLHGPLDIDSYPAQIVRQAQGTVSWFLDKTAASKL
jgi:6-phosphogluconolactonase